MLSHWVRDKRKIGIEAAIRRMTSDLARDVGLADRGTIAEGGIADLVVFDPQTVGRYPQEAVSDVPGGGFRFLHHSTGIHRTIVNGAIVFEGSNYTNERPGRVV